MFVYAKHKAVYVLKMVDKAEKQRRNLGHWRQQNDAAFAAAEYVCFCLCICKMYYRETRE